MSGALNNYVGTTNPNYLVQITNYGDGGQPIIGPMSERFALRIASQWEQAFASSFIPGLETFNKFAQPILGASLYAKTATGHVYKYSDPISLNVDLQFDSIQNTVNDVTFPVMKLASWASPVRNGPVLFAPGPSITNQNARISLRIGRYLYFDSVIMPSVDITWIVAPDSPGQFIGADVSINFITFFTPDRTDVLNYFGSGPNTSSNPLFFGG